MVNSKINLHSSRGEKKQTVACEENIRKQIKSFWGFSIAINFFFLELFFSQIIKNVEYTVQLQAGTERGKREEINIFTFEWIIIISHFFSSANYNSTQ